MKNHTELLNGLAEKYKLINYLEIGVQNPTNNFYKIICPNKTGIDPQVSEVRQMTSDDYFAAISNNDPQPVFDLIFIDGLHHADQVKRDFENSLQYLSDTGYIVIHDVLPENEQGAKVPRETRQWWGDVYKFAMNLKAYKGISWVTYDIDNGCCVVRKDKGRVLTQEWNDNYSWADYRTVGMLYMNVTKDISI